MFPFDDGIMTQDTYHFLTVNNLYQREIGKSPTRLFLSHLCRVNTGKSYTSVSCQYVNTETSPTAAILRKISSVIMNDIALVRT